jgi:hypothetical protein
MSFSPFANCSISIDLLNEFKEYEKIKDKYKKIDKMEKEIYKPCYRIYDLKSDPVLDEFNVKINKCIYYNNKSGILMISKKRPVPLRFSDDVNYMIYNPHNNIKKFSLLHIKG